eukprot:jgi/Mesvir1/1591/Mv14559-RA.1
MKVKTLQVVWHEKEPVFSLDYHPSGLLVTGGADKELKLWRLENDQEGEAFVQFLSSLGGYHVQAINAVRFSPSGSMLASAGDGGELMLWRQVEGGSKAKDGAPGSEMTWKAAATLRGHHMNVQDVAWSPDGAFLVSGSVDNTVTIWDVATGKPLETLQDHQHYVQGVAWDPGNRLVASQSGDRTARVYSIGPSLRPFMEVETGGKKAKAVAREPHLTCTATIFKAEVPEVADASSSNAAQGVAGGKATGAGAPAGEGAEGAAGGMDDGTAAGAKSGGPGKKAKSRQVLFHDETMPSFFRRLAWSPDGSFLVIPAGLYKRAADLPATNVTYIFSRKDFSRPLVILPGPGDGTVAVRFCPVFFRRTSNEGGDTPAKKGSRPENACTAFQQLPYRIVFAVASMRSVFIYDTHSSQPVAVIGGLHFTAITDLAWSKNGRFLTVSSTDGYCSVVSFEEGELGTPLPWQELPQTVQDILRVQSEGPPRAPTKDAVKDKETSLAGGKESASSDKAATTPTGRPGTGEDAADGGLAPPTERIAEADGGGKAEAKDKPKARRVVPVSVTGDAAATAGNLTNAFSESNAEPLEQEVFARQLPLASEDSEKKQVEASVTNGAAADEAVQAQEGMEPAAKVPRVASGDEVI